MNRTLLDILKDSLVLYKAFIFHLIPYSLPLSIATYFILPTQDVSEIHFPELLWMPIMVGLAFLVMMIFQAALILRLNDLMMEAILSQKIIRNDLFTKSINKALPLALVIILNLAIVVIGLILLIVPGIYLAVVLVFSSFIIVLKNDESLVLADRIKNAFIESYELVKGNWWRVAAFVLLLGLLNSVIEQSIVRQFQEPLLLKATFIIFMRTFLIPVWYVCMMCLMRDLEIRKESQRNPKMKNDGKGIYL